MTLVQAAPRLISGEPVPRHQRDSGYIVLRRKPTEDGEATPADAAKPAEAPADEAPATRRDLARLGAQLAGLIAREEARYAAPARIEVALADAIEAVEALGERVERWAEDRT